MIWVPRPKDFPELEIPGRTYAEGWFKFETLKVDAHGVPIEASRKVVADWFPNLILDQGLDRIGANADMLNNCQIGTGNATPSATQTSLQTFLTGASTINATNSTAQATPPYYRSRIRTYRFAAGPPTGTIAEVGVGWSATGSTLFSRALILDGMGNPTTITVLIDEVLDVTYEYRLYVPNVDQTYNATITGVGTLSVTARAGNVTSTVANVGTTSGGILNSAAVGRVFSGLIGPVTGAPAGTASTSSDRLINAYTGGTLQRSGNVIFGLANGNIAGGIKSLEVVFGNSNGFGNMQYEFSSVINKLNTQVLTFNMTHSWARRP